MKWVMQLLDPLPQPDPATPASEPAPRRKRRPRIVPKRRIRRRWPTPAEMVRAARKAEREKLKAKPKKQRKRRKRTREEREALLYAGRRYEDVSQAALDRDFRDERLERRKIVNIAALGDPPPGRWRP
jgi:predicted metal-dependent hydrolase